MSIALFLALSGFACVPSACGQKTTVDVKPSTNQQSPDKIELANQLHQEAAHLLDRKEIEKAIDKEKEAVQLVPNYWLPHAALGYLYFGRGGPAIQEASESIKTAHPVLADINLALLLRYFHMYEQSRESFKSLLTADPHSCMAKVGLATSLIGMSKIDEGRKLLDEAYASKPTDSVVLDAIARAYFDAGELNKTKVICQEALASSSDAKLSERLRKLLLVAAVNTSDADVLNSFSNTSLDLQPYEQLWLKGMQLKFAKDSAEAGNLLRTIDSENPTNQQWLSLAAILQERANGANDKQSWLQMAKSCLQHAEKIEPNNVEIRIRLAAIEEKLGDEQRALKKITEGWNSAPFVPSTNTIGANDQLANKEVTELAKSIFDDAKNRYRTNLSAVEISLPKVTCSCRYKLIRYAAMNLPGVINVMIQQGPHPTALVLFDNHICSKDSIFADKAITNLHETLEIGQERQLATISDVDDAITKFEIPLPAPSFFAESVTLRFPSVDRSFLGATEKASF